ncbi:MAG: hypothetical protein IKU51_07195, partial [Clostridia bacterium]|nr:hypothetical protein [Clostridia bacterium]
PTLRHYSILYYDFPFVKHFFRLGLFFCYFLGFLGDFRENGRKCGGKGSDAEHTEALFYVLA